MNLVGPSLPENLDFQRLAQPQLCDFIFINIIRKVGVAQNSRQRDSLNPPQLCGFFFINTNRKLGVAQNSRQVAICLYKWRVRWHVRAICLYKPTACGV